MDEFDYDNADKGRGSEIGEEEGERLLQFSKECTVIRIKKVHTLENFKMENMINEIEETFALIKELQLPDFCLKLWLKLIEIKNELKNEMLYSTELCIALNELLYLAKYLFKGGGGRGFIQ